MEVGEQGWPPRGFNDRIQLRSYRTMDGQPICRLCKRVGHVERACREGGQRPGWAKWHQNQFHNAVQMRRHQGNTNSTTTMQTMTEPSVSTPAASASRAASTSIRSSSSSLT